MDKPRFPTISKRKNPGGKVVYRINYVDPWDGKRYQPVVSSRKDEAIKEAKRVYDQMMAKYFGETGQIVKEATISEALDEFFNSKLNRVRASTVRRYRIYTDNFSGFMAHQFSGVKFISKITRGQIEEFLQHLKQQDQAPGTINAELRVIRSVFKFALENGHLITNPADKIEKFFDPKKSEEIQFWSKDQVELILQNVTPHWRDKFEFLYHTGLREGELINLRWDAVSIDGDNPKIKIQATEDWIPKTNERREIPLNAIAVEILRRQVKTEGQPYVFTSKEGHKIKAKLIYDRLNVTLKKLGLPGSVHTFRHTFASHLVMKAAGIETVSKLLGHSTIEMTMKYAHLAPDYLRKAVDLLS